jgi:hypothetical protein
MGSTSIVFFLSSEWDLFVHVIAPAGASHVGLTTKLQTPVGFPEKLREKRLQGFGINAETVGRLRDDVRGANVDPGFVEPVRIDLSRGSG